MKKKKGEVLEKPLSAYINALVSEIDYTKLTDQEYEIKRNEMAIRGIIRYLQYKFGEED